LRPARSPCAGPLTGRRTLLVRGETVYVIVICVPPVN
jgi:hypothetical protein